MARNSNKGSRFNFEQHNDALPDDIGLPRWGAYAGELDDSNSSQQSNPRGSIRISARGKNAPMNRQSLLDVLSNRLSSVSSGESNSQLNFAYARRHTNPKSSRRSASRRSASRRSASRNSNSNKSSDSGQEEAIGLFSLLNGPINKSNTPSNSTPPPYSSSNSAGNKLKNSASNKSVSKRSSSKGNSSKTSPLSIDASVKSTTQKADTASPIKTEGPIKTISPPRYDSVVRSAPNNVLLGLGLASMNEHQPSTIEPALPQVLPQVLPQAHTLIRASEPMPSIITVLIYAHGGDMPDQPFEDPSVRIISFAGRSGSNYFGDNRIFDTVKNIFNTQHKAYDANIPFKGKNKFLEQLYGDNPRANKCEVMPNFSFDGDSVTPQSSYDFLNNRITRGSHVDDYRATVVRRNITNSIGAKYAHADSVENLSHRLHTPVIDKNYSFIDLAEPSLPSKFKFGIYVMDICNYDRSAPGNVNIKVDDNLAISKKAYNSQFLDEINENNKSFNLSQLVEHLHSLGFQIINLIDLGCRGCRTMTQTKRDELTARENMLSERIDRAYGRKSRRRRGKRPKGKYSRRSRAHA